MSFNSRPKQSYSVGANDAPACNESTLISGINNSGLQTPLTVTDDGEIEIVGTVTIEPSIGSLVDRSGSATTLSVEIASVNANRKYFFIQNISAGTIWMNFGTVAIANQPSIRLQSGDAFVMEGNFVTTQTINVIAASGTLAFTAKEGN